MARILPNYYKQYLSRNLNKSKNYELMGGRVVSHEVEKLFLKIKISMMLSCTQHSLYHVIFSTLNEIIGIFFH